MAERSGIPRATGRARQNTGHGAARSCYFQITALNCQIETLERQAQRNSLDAAGLALLEKRPVLSIDPKKRLPRTGSIDVSVNNRTSGGAADGCSDMMEQIDDKRAS